MIELFGSASDGIGQAAARAGQEHDRQDDDEHADEPNLTVR
jgi:hypothetical protein